MGSTPGRHDELQHGVFTYYLLRGISGMAVGADARSVSLESLSGYVRRKVSVFVSNKLHKNQDPQHRNAGSGSSDWSTCRSWKPGVPGPSPAV